MNALKHGMCAETVVLRNEIEGQFYELITGYFRDFAPVTSAEEDLITEMAVCRWRLRRTWMIETVMFQLSMDRTENAVEEEYEDPDDGTRITTAWNHMADESTGYKLLTRYESRLARRYDKALATFRILKKDRLLQNGPTSSPPSAPVPDAVAAEPQNGETNLTQLKPESQNCETNLRVSAPVPGRTTAPVPGRAAAPVPGRPTAPTPGKPAPQNCATNSNALRAPATPPAPQNCETNSRASAPVPGQPKPLLTDADIDELARIWSS
jgi:hypothetical protein